jgi:hypothetical protein
MWACMNARERHALCGVKRAAGAAHESSKAEVTCMARLVACRDAMAAGRGSGCVVGVRALWTIVRHTHDEWLRSCFLMSSGLRLCMLASSESYTFSVGCGKRAQGLPDAPCLTLETMTLLRRCTSSKRDGMWWM